MDRAICRACVGPFGASSSLSVPVKDFKRQKDHSVRGAGRCDEHWLDAMAIWEKAFQSLDLRKVVDDYIGIGRVPREKVLVIVLSREEGSARFDDSDDRGVECMRIVELGDVGFRNPLGWPIRRYRRDSGHHHLPA